MWRRSEPDRQWCYGAEVQPPSKNVEEGWSLYQWACVFVCLEGCSRAGAYLCRWCRFPRSPACRYTGVLWWCWCRWRSHHTNSGHWRTRHALGERIRIQNPACVFVVWKVGRGQKKKKESLFFFFFQLSNRKICVNLTDERTVNKQAGREYEAAVELLFCK